MWKYETNVSRAPKCENNMKIIWTKIWKSCDFSISHYFHMLFILFSFFYHIFRLGTQIRAPKVIFLSYSWSYFFHIIFIFLWKPRFPACPYGQSLQHIHVWKWYCQEYAHDMNIEVQIRVPSSQNRSDPEMSKKNTKIVIREKTTQRLHYNALQSCHFVTLY